MNTNIPSKSALMTTDNKITSSEVKGTRKRAASDEFEGPAKKIMLESSSYEKQPLSVASKSTAQPKFVSAAEVAANARTTVQMMPEISDAEFLQMAQKFEMEHPE